MDILKVNSPFYSGSEHVGSTYIIYGYDWLSLCKYFHLFVHVSSWVGLTGHRGPSQGHRRTWLRQASTACEAQDICLGRGRKFVHREHAAHLCHWSRKKNWSVLWNMFYFPMGIIIPTDLHIFQRGWSHQPDNVAILEGSCCDKCWFHIVPRILWKFGCCYSTKIHQPGQIVYSNWHRDIIRHILSHILCMFVYFGVDISW